jgi:uncharacterized integral membrane protein
VRGRPRCPRGRIKDASRKRPNLGRRTGLYTWAVGLVALLVILVALVVTNTRQVMLSWVAGTGQASLVWIILAAAVLGRLLGILTSEVFRLRTRRGRPS